MSQATIWIDKDAISTDNVLDANNFVHSVDVDPELSWVVRALATYCTLDPYRGVNSMKLAIVLPRILNIRIGLVASETLGRTIGEVGDFGKSQSSPHMLVFLLKPLVASIMFWGVVGVWGVGGVCGV